MQRIEQNKSVFLEPRRKAEFNPVSCYLCLFACLLFVCLFVHCLLVVFLIADDGCILRAYH